MSDTAATALVRLLQAHGVDRVFSVAGESFLAVLDALYDAPSIDVVTCRHEGAAGFMAMADAKLTGGVGICFVNRGPGAMNAAIALHSADQDATPMILFVGHVRRHEMGRRSFQEVDYPKTFSDVAKGVWVVQEPAAIAEVVMRAFRMARANTPGPVVVVLPEDVLAQAGSPTCPAPAVPRPAAPRPADVEEVAAQIARASRPLLIAGGRLTGAEARQALRQCAEAHALPVAVSNKHQDLLDNEHPHYAGHLHLATPRAQTEMLAEADLVVAIGTRLGGVTTQGYALPRSPHPRQPLIHVYPDAGQIGRDHETACGLACDPALFLQWLCRQQAPAPTAARQDWIRKLHAYEVAEARWEGPDAGADGLLLGGVVAALGRQLGNEAVVTVDAGNFTTWVHRHFRFRSNHVLLGIASSAMGFGVPSGVAAALRMPGHQVITFVGDGGFMMLGSELATAVQRRIPLRIIVANNQSYGTIRQHQERAYPGRVIATELENPDFAALARAYGALGVTVTAAEEIEPALQQALAHSGPAVLDVHTSLEHISAYRTISSLHAPGRSIGQGSGKP